MKVCKILFIKEYAFFIFWISITWEICYCLECYTNTDVDYSGPVVATKAGTIAGKYINVLDKEIAAFLGIPFAKPPLGERRFKISEPIEVWSGTLLAKEKSPACMQYSSQEVKWLPPPTFNFSEDCLYLNIWLPPNCCCNRMDKLPVMAFIHGGGYYSGSAMMDIYDGGVLATLGEVIVVTFNYRLNVFGFLNLDSKDAPGNMGLYDQLLALKWIRQNIASFGGNPNRVTLFGESAGSFSVSLHMVSPLSRNLFHKAILESGTSVRPKTVDNINSSFSKAIEYSKVLGCSIKRSNLKSISKDILHCLKEKNNIKLAIADNYFTSKFPQFFSPSYGNKCDDCLKYFLESPSKNLQSGRFSQIPTLTGNNKDEGTLFMIYNIPRLFKFDQKPLLTVSVAKKALQEFFKSIKLSKIPSSRIFDYYMKEIEGGSSDGPLQVVSMIYSDYLMKCANMALADNARNVYYYLFSHRSLNDNDDKWVGVPHFAEIPYVFGEPIRDTQNYTLEDKKVSEDIIQKFTSFAHNGYPVTRDTEPNWPQYSSSDRKVFEFNAERNRVIQFPSQKACDMIWKPIYSFI